MFGEFYFGEPYFADGTTLVDTVTPVTSKNPSHWRPANGKGYIISPGQSFIVDNSGNFIVDNSGNFIVTTPDYVTGLNPTLWVETEAS